MKINHDYSYVNQELVELGYATVKINSLNFGRYYSEEEKAKNRRQGITMSPVEWSRSCDAAGKEICERMEKMMSMLGDKYHIFQYNDKYGQHDLYFWSNKGANNKEWYDHIQLCFNDKRSQAENTKLLSELLEFMEKQELENICCRVQYDISIDSDKLHNAALEICKNLADRFVQYEGKIGKIKCVDEYNGNKNYGFFKKGAKNKYYTIQDTVLICNIPVLL